MRPIKFVMLCGALAAMLMLLPRSGQAQNSLFAELSGSPNLNTTNWVLVGDAKAGDTPGDANTHPDELVLLSAFKTNGGFNTNSSGAAYYNQPLSLSTCQQWRAEFDFRIYDGTSGGGGDGADGICFFVFPDPPQTYIRGGGIGIPPTPVGLMVVFDQWNNCGPKSEHPQLQVRFGDGKSNYQECPGDTQPTVGPLPFLRSNSYQHCEVTYNNGLLEVFLNGTKYVSTNYNLDFSGFFGFTSATGGQVDTHSILNFKLFTGNRLKIRPQPGPNHYFCTGDTVQLGIPADTANVSYSWFPTTGLNNPNIPNPTLTLTHDEPFNKTVNYFLTKDTVGVGGCGITDFVQITIRGNGAQVRNQLTFCNGTQPRVNFAGLPKYEYLWQPAAGLSDSTAPNPKLLLTNPDSISITKQYVLRAIDSVLGCVSYDTMVAKVHPNGAKASPDLFLCSGQVDTLSGLAVSTYTYYWTPLTGMVNPMLSLQLHAPIQIYNTTGSPLTINYQLNAISQAYGCTQKDTQRVTVYPHLWVDILNNDTLVCSGSALQLRAQAATGAQITWLGDTATLSHTDSLTTTFVAQNKGQTNRLVTLYAKVVDEWGHCSAWDTIYIEVEPANWQNLINDTTVCPGTAATLQPKQLMGYSYHWHDTSAMLQDTLSTQPVFNAKNAQASTQKVLLKLKLKNNTTGCTRQDTALVVIRPAVEVNAGNDTLICYQDTILRGQATPGHSYQWQTNSGFVQNPTTVPTRIALGGTQTNRAMLALTATRNTDGCQATDTITISGLQIKNPIGLAFVSTCVSDSVIIATNALPDTGLSYLWQTSVPLLSHTNRIPVQAASNNPGSYWLRLTTTHIKTGCQQTDSIQLTVWPQPDSWNLANRYACPGDTLNLGADTNLSAVGYHWQQLGSTPASIITPVASSKIRVHAPNADTVAYRAVFAFTQEYTNWGCAHTDTVAVDVGGLPVAVATSLGAVCARDSFLLSTPHRTGYQYAWHPAGGLLQPSQHQTRGWLPQPATDSIMQPFSLTAYRIADGCQHTDTVNQVVYAHPAAPVTTDTALCGAQSVAVGASPKVGLQYQWQPGGGLNDSTAANPVFTAPYNPTNHTVNTILRLTTKNNYGCQSTDSVLVQALPNALLALSDTVVACARDSLTLNVLGPANQIYFWQGHGNTVAPTLTLFASTDTIWQQHVTAFRGQCQATESAYVKFLGLPPGPNLYGPTVVCPGAQGMPYAIVGGLPNNHLVGWQAIGGQIAPNKADTALVNWNAPNPNAQVQAWLTDTNACQSDTAILPVTVNTLLQPQLPTGPDSLCLHTNDTLHYETYATPNSTYIWGIQGGNIVAGQGGAKVATVFTQPGKARIWIDETVTTNTNMCFGASDTLTVTIWPTPKGHPVVAPEAVCLGDTFTLSLLTDSTYHLDFIYPPGIELLSQAGNQFVVATTQTGLLALGLQQTTTHGCQGPVNPKQVRVNSLPGIKLLTTPDTICANGLRGATYFVKTAPTDSTVWRLSGGDFVLAKGDSATVNWHTNAPIRRLWAYALSQHGCPSDTVVFEPTFKVQYPQLQWVTLQQQQATQATIHYHWPGNKGGFIRLQYDSLPQPQRISLLTATQTYIFNDSLLAQQVAYVTLGAEDFCGDTLYSLKHNTVVLQGNQTDTVASVWWQPNSGAQIQSTELWQQTDHHAWRLINTLPPADTVATNLSLSAGFNTCFRLVFYDTAGFVGYSSIRCFWFNHRPFIPNVITPNGDGLNDFFIIENLKLFSRAQLTITNRWGKVVHSNNNYRNQWQGNGLANGVYFYTINLSHPAAGIASKKYSGWVQLIR